MNLKSETCDTKIVLELFGRRFDISVDDNTVSVCEEIRREAAERLNMIKSEGENCGDIL